MHYNFIFVEGGIEYHLPLMKLFTVSRIIYC